MDVQLPDGSVVQGVPDDMSRADLTAKLLSNGYSREQLGLGEPPQSKGLVSRVLDFLGEGRTPYDPNKPIPVGVAGGDEYARGGDTQTSVMDGYKAPTGDTSADINAGFGPMRQDYLNKTKAAVQSLPLQDQQKLAQGNDQVAKIARAQVPKTEDRVQRLERGQVAPETADELALDTQTRAFPSVEDRVGRLQAAQKDSEKAWAANREAALQGLMRENHLDRATAEQYYDQMRGAGTSASDRARILDTGAEVLSRGYNFSDTAARLPGELLKAIKQSGYAADAAVGMAASTVGRAADSLYQVISDKPDTPIQDYIFEHAVAPFVAAQAQLNPDPMTGFSGRLAHTLGGLSTMLLEGALTGGATFERQLATTVAGVLANSGRQALAAMAIPAVTSMINTGQEAYAKTGDMRQAAAAMGATYLATTVMGVIPASIEAGPLARGLIGAATMPVTMEALHPLGQVGLPDSMRSERTNEDRILDAVLGAGFGVAMHGRPVQSAAKDIRQTYMGPFKPEPTAEQQQASNAYWSELHQYLREKASRPSSDLSQETGAVQPPSLSEREEAIKSRLDYAADHTLNGYGTLPIPGSVRTADNLTRAVTDPSVTPDQITEFAKAAVDSVGLVGQAAAGVEAARAATEARVAGFAQAHEAEAAQRQAEADAAEAVFAAEKRKQENTAWYQHGQQADDLAVAEANAKDDAQTRADAVEAMRQANGPMGQAFANAKGASPRDIKRQQEQQAAKASRAARVGQQARADQLRAEEEGRASTPRDGEQTLEQDPADFGLSAEEPVHPPPVTGEEKARAEGPLPEPKPATAKPEPATPLGLKAGVPVEIPLGDGTTHATRALRFEELPHQGDGVTRADAVAMAAHDRLFGTQHVVVDSLPGKAHGYQVGKDGVVYVARNTGGMALAIHAHETGHVIDRALGDDHAKIKLADEAVLKTLTDEAKARYMLYYGHAKVRPLLEQVLGKDVVAKYAGSHEAVQKGKDGAWANDLGITPEAAAKLAGRFSGPEVNHTQELRADLRSHAMRDVSYWRTFRDALVDKYGEGEAKTIFQKLVDGFKRLIDAYRNMRGNQSFTVKDLVSNHEEIYRAIAEADAEYWGSRKMEGGEVSHEEYRPIEAGPYKTKKMAEMYARQKPGEYEVVPHEGGWAVRARGTEAGDDEVGLAATRRDDLFPEEFADKRSSVPLSVVVSSKGGTETIRVNNINSVKRAIAPTKQALKNFWDWFHGSEAVDKAGRPLVLYHSTNGDFSTFETGRKSSNNYGLFGDIETERHGIFATDDTGFSQEYLKSGAGQNVMPIYMDIKTPLDLRGGLSEADAAYLEKSGIRTRAIHNVQNTWELFDDQAGNDFVVDLKKAGYDGAILHETGQDGETHTTYVAFGPTQIKSASGNRGTFSRESTDVRMSTARSGKKQLSDEARAVWAVRAQAMGGAGGAGENSPVRSFIPQTEIDSDVKKADEYEKHTGFRPYVPEKVVVPVEPSANFSTRRSGSNGQDPATGLWRNGDGTVNLYLHTTNAEVRRIHKDKFLRDTTGEGRIILTDESSAARVIKPSDEGSDLGGVVMVKVDPALLNHLSDNADGSKTFFIPTEEGTAFKARMQMWALHKSRSESIAFDATIDNTSSEIQRAMADWAKATVKERAAMVRSAKALLLREHNVGTLMTENGKLESTRDGEFGLKGRDGRGVDSLGLGLAAAQKISDKWKNTCPQRAICEGSCLGDTAGGNRMYGGAASEDSGFAERSAFRSGPRLSQFLKTEALLQHPYAFAVKMQQEIASLLRWDAKQNRPPTTDSKGVTTEYSPNGYSSAIRLNVTSDIPPKVWKGLIEANPDVTFYDYTKLGGEPIADNHHLTYSSTGASQEVNGETVLNPHQNWDRMRSRLDRGFNVAMAFSHTNKLPKFVVDEATGNRYQVWSGDDYDARYLDPKREDGVGMVIGLTKKDSGTRDRDATKKSRGFFLNYDPDTHGDTVVIPDQSKYAAQVAELRAKEKAEKSAFKGIPVKTEDPARHEGGAPEAVSTSAIPSAGSDIKVVPGERDVKASTARDYTDIKPDELTGKDVRVPVRIEDTGETAHLTLDAKDAVEGYTSRQDTFSRLLECLG